MYRSRMMVVGVALGLMVCGFWLVTPCALAEEAGKDAGPAATAEERKPATAAKEAEPKPRPPARSGDELLIFQELPVVVSAARQPQPINRSSTPIAVVSAEDIHYGGLTTLPEVLQFVPGMDVLEFDRNRYAVGVRGLHEYFSDRTLTLINGRNAESPLYGGSEFVRYPLFLEDIERVEVVRGPGGAAWGANAFNGVINIITKKPEDVQGVLATSTVDEFGETSSQVRWGAKKGNWNWRTSFGYQEQESSESVIHEDDFFSMDFYRRATFDGEAAYKISDDTKISFGVGYQYQKQGDFEFLGYFPHEDARYDTTRAFVRADHRFSSDLSAYVQWFGNFSNNESPALLTSSSMQNDLETQVNYEIAQGHHLSVGGNVRWTRIGTRDPGPQDLLFPDQPFNEYFAGLFALYRWQAAKPVTFEAQVRGDWYSETQTDWAGRLSVLYSPDERQDHSLRFSTAKAFRTPLVGLRDLRTSRIPIPAFPPFIPPGLHVLNIYPDEGLDNEEIWSFEMGYTGRLVSGLTLRADGYYQRYEGLIGFHDFSNVPLGLPPPLSNSTSSTAKNIGDATAWGGELELAFTGRLGRLSAWYAFNDLAVDKTGQPLRAFRPAKNKAGLTGRMFLPHQVTLNLNYRFAGRTEGDNNNFFFDAPSTHRLDFTVSKKLDNGRFELLGGVTDALNQTKKEVRGAGCLTGHETPGRTFFGRFQMKF